MTTPAPDSSASPSRSFTVRLKRQDRADSEPYWQSFTLPYKPGLNITSVLEAVAADPVTADGRATTPPTWEAACLEEVCGSCTMVINGHVRQGCSTLVDELLEIQAGEGGAGGQGAGGGTITIEPMSKFPVIRDLVVDRSRMFEDLKRIKGWVPVDGTHDLGPGPRESQENQEMRYALSRCMTCGCCVEACPQYTIDNNFTGPAIFAQTLYFNLHETGKALKPDRLRVMMGPGGITDCGNAQNCVKVCPKGVPITEAIAAIGKQTTTQAVKDFFRGK